MTQPVNACDMVCTADGVTWTSRALFLPAADGGLILAWNGLAVKYDRCPDQPAAETVTTATDVGITG